MSELLDHLQEAIMRGEPHHRLALMVQNIRAEFARLPPPPKADAPSSNGAGHGKGQETEGGIE